MDKNNIIISNINSQKKKSISLELKFTIGLVYLKNIENIIKINNIKEKYNIDFILIIRIKQNNALLENLIYNYKLINEHIIIDNFNNNNSFNKIMYDYLFIF